MSRIRLLLPAFALLFSTLLAHADEPAKASADDSHCAAGSAHCQHVQIRIQMKCPDNPEKCEEVRQKMLADAAECRADPQACKEKRRARREALCQAHPDRPICRKSDTPAAAQ